MGRIVNQTNYAELGFDTPQQAKVVTPGRPMRIATLQLDRLARYNPGDDISALLSDDAETLYPLMIGNDVKSSFTIAGAGHDFTASRFGDATIAVRLASPQTVCGATVVPDEFIIHVPVFGLYLVAGNSGGNLMLTSVSDTSALGIQRCAPQRAAQFLRQLGVHARLVVATGPI